MVISLGFAIAKEKKVFLHSEDPEIFELGPKTNAFYHHPDIIRLQCPLSDVGAALQSFLAEPATIL